MILATWGSSGSIIILFLVGEVQTCKKIIFVRLPGFWFRNFWISHKICVNQFNCDEYYSSLDIDLYKNKSSSWNFPSGQDSWGRDKQNKTKVKSVQLDCLLKLPIFVLQNTATPKIGVEQDWVASESNPTD